MDFPVAQLVHNLPAMHETRIQSLSQGEPLEKGLAIQFSFLPWKFPWTEKPGGLQSMGVMESYMTELLTLSLLMVEARVWRL